jgi:hypothetical protein
MGAYYGASLKLAQLRRSESAKLVDLREKFEIRPFFAITSSNGLRYETFVLFLRKTEVVTLNEINKFDAYLISISCVRKNIGSAVRNLGNTFIEVPRTRKNYRT